MNPIQHAFRVAGIAAVLSAAAMVASSPATLAAPAAAPASGAPGTAAVGNAGAPATRPAPAAVGLAPAAVAKPRNFVVVNGQVGGAIVGVNANAAMQQKASINSYQQSIARLPDGGTHRLDDLLHITLQDGLLKVEAGAIAGLRGQSRVKIEGMDDPAAAKAAWMINVQDMRMRAGMGWVRQSFIAICRYDWDQIEEGQIWCTQLNCNDSYFMITGQGLGSNVYYNQVRAQNQVMLQMREVRPGANKAAVMLHAANLLQLQREHPEEVRKYLAPLLMRLTNRDMLRPGAADIYGVFTEITPAPQIQQTVMALLPRLDDEQFKQREQASADLAKLGIPGVLVAMRLDPAILTEEQKARLESFISTERRRTIDDPDAARKDPLFLLEAMDDEDAAVRTAAKAGLETAMGHPVSFDTTLDHKPRTTAVDALRKDVRKELAARAAATQPATAPAGDAAAAPANAPVNVGGGGRILLR